MTIEMFIVIIVVGCMLIGLIFEIAQPAFIVFTAFMVLILTNIITTSEALRGFSNEGMLTIALLFIIASVISKSPLLYKLIYKLIGNSSSYRTTLVRMMIPISSLSAFFNNTPIVVMMIPIIRKWCKEHHISPSKFLLPLSYASIFGGMITLIGTATNLVVHGLMLDSGMEGFTMFQLTIISGPAALFGIMYLYFFGSKLLPEERKTLEKSFIEEQKDFLTKGIVTRHCELVGKKIKDANLRGLFLMEIIRNDEHITPVLPNEIIQAKDHLIFSGKISTILELQKIKGLEIATNPNMTFHHLNKKKLALVEAVVSTNSNLLHQTIKESDIRKKYKANVVAIRKYQQNESEKIGDIPLHAGDTLLMLVDEDFIKTWKEKFFEDFFIVSEVDAPIKQSSIALAFPILVLVLMIGFASFHIISMFEAALIATFIFIVTNYLKPEKIVGYIDFSVLLLIACSFGIGIAIEKTGLASILANYVIEFAGFFGVIGVIVALYLITNIFTELITNTAAAVIMFPVALAISEQMNISPIAVIMIITIAASASFATPIGYQTNLIVYSQGGYKYIDFLKVGLPLSAIYMIVTITIVYLFLI